MSDTHLFSDLSFDTPLQTVARRIYDLKCGLAGEFLRVLDDDPTCSYYLEFYARAFLRAWKDGRCSDFDACFLFAYLYERASLLVKAQLREVFREAGAPGAQDVRPY